MENVSLLIDMLGGSRRLAASLGLAPSTVASWKARQALPAKYDLQILSLAREKGVSVSLNDLARARCPAPASEEAA